MSITPKIADTLRYFEAMAELNEWFQHDRTKTAADLGICRQSLTGHIKRLIDHGYMEIIPTRHKTKPLYRIIRSSCQLPKRRVKPKKLIRYAGYDHTEMYRP